MMKILRADNLDSGSHIGHGFFTRNGGVSSGLYASLNCALASADSRENVGENRMRVREVLGAEYLCTLRQIHSSEVITVTEPYSGDAVPEGDAMVTDRAGIALGVLTADCVPLLFADMEAKIIGAAHAGWQGAFSGVSEATLGAMENLGARRKNIAVAVGPAIAQASYEVGEEFYRRFVDDNAENERFFISSYYFNLPAYVESRLKNSGITNINMLEHDTCSMESDFFSYRRATLRGEVDYGRQISCIVIG